LTTLIHANHRSRDSSQTEAEMKFKKLIVTPGVHNVGRLNGKSEAVALTPERLQGWVDNTNLLRDLGFQIPAPFAHQDKNLNFPLPVVRVGEDGASLADAYNPANGLTWDAQLNGGFWDDKLQIDPETKGIIGMLDAPGEITDTTSPAGKVGTVVRETSVLVMGPRKVIGKDGKEHQIGEHLAHVAMVMHPAQPGQRNFEPVNESKLPSGITADDVKVAMSFAMSDLLTANSGAPGMITASTLDDPTKAKDQELVDTITMLANVVYISLPANTTRENFLENLNICLRQKSADNQEKEREQESLTTRPDGTEAKGPSIAMSHTITSNGFIAMTQQATPPAAPSSTDTLLVMAMSNLVKDRKKSLKERVTALVATGRCTATFAQEKLLPRIEGFAMSAEQLTAAGGDAAKVRDVVEDLIDGLEQANPLAGNSLVDDGAAAWGVPSDATVETVPNSGDAGLSEADEDAIINDALQFA
jgi:hypothetical protein